MDEMLKAARERMKSVCKVCKVCDGRNCPTAVPGMGGAGTGAGFRANLEALADLAINMRLIHKITDPETGFDFFGQRLTMPVMAAPVAGMKINLGDSMGEQEYIKQVVDGCRAFGTLGWCGDGVPDLIYQAGLTAIEAHDGAGVPVFKPWEEQELFRKLDEARPSGVKVIAMDIDAVGLITPRKMGRPIYPKTISEFQAIFQRHGHYKFILKGVMTVADAMAALEAGAAGIVVSNHGGRVLDHTPGTAEVLPAIAEAVEGRMMVLADGGVRSGGDVLKMLALGADAVLVGRPVAIAAIGGGADGVAAYFQAMQAELISAMILTGCQDLTAIDRQILYQA